MTVKTRDITRNAQRTNYTFGTGAGGGTDPNSSMGRKPRHSPAQRKQTGNITLQRTRSSSDSLRIVLADAGTNIRRINRLAKQTHRDSKRDIRNAQKWELRAIQKANLAIAEVEDLQAQVEELTATMEAGQQEAARVVEGLEERNEEMKKKLRRFQTQLY